MEFDDLQNLQGAETNAEEGSSVEPTHPPGAGISPNRINELVADHSLILHLAARNIIASTANPLDDYATNIGGTLNILMAARASKAGAPLPRRSSTRASPRPESILRRPLRSARAASARSRPTTRTSRRST